MQDQIIQQAKALPVNGSLTFKMLVAQRDWPSVYEMAGGQVDSMHGISSLSSRDWDYINTESAKDGCESREEG